MVELFEQNMYESRHTVDDVEKGHVVLWNGRERTVTSTRGMFVIIDDEAYSKETVDEWLQSPDMPFELLE